MSVNSTYYDYGIGNRFATSMRPRITSRDIVEILYWKVEFDFLYSHTGCYRRINRITAMCFFSSVDVGRLYKVIGFIADCSQCTYQVEVETVEALFDEQGAHREEHGICHLLEFER